MKYIVLIIILIIWDCEINFSDNKNYGQFTFAISLKRSSLENSKTENEQDEATVWEVERNKIKNERKNNCNVNTKSPNDVRKPVL